jgi:hypothetical protein
MKRIEIDVSKVPFSMRFDSRFRNLHARVEQEFELPHTIDNCCIHEAGHIIYLRRAGVKDFGYLGPRIEYRPLTDTFHDFWAAVKPDYERISPDPTFSGEDLIRALARGMAAGGIFTLALTNRTVPGDADDYRIFGSLWDMLLKDSPNIAMSQENVWKGAQEDIERDLKNDLTLREQVRITADEIRPKLFPNC